jgi:hypothetical protein
MLKEDRSPAQLRRTELGFAWWIVVLIIAIVVIIVAAITYVATKPSDKVIIEPKNCAGGSVDVEAWLRGASTGTNYTVTTTATRRCDLGQSCTCATIQGSFGTPTTPCDQYQGNAGPVTSTDTVTPAPLVTDFKKSISNLREGVWEISVTVATPGYQSVTKTCCVIVQSGQTSSVTFWCKSLGLPGPGGRQCVDCTSSTTPPGPIGLQPVP